MVGEKFLLFIVLLGVLVTVHELGHFLVAKLCRVQVFKFSIGFGPELLAFSYGETRYAIAAVPLGGFVRMAGEDDLIERWGGPDAPPVDPARVLTAKPLWQRAAIILAGPLANILLPLLVFSAASYGQSEIAPPVVETVLPETPAEAAGLRSGDRVRAIDGEAVAEFTDIAALVGPRAGETVTVELERDGQLQRLALTLHGAASRDELQRVVERGRVGVGAFRRLPVVAPDPGAPAQQAGVQPLDRVLAIDGQPLKRYEDLERELRARADRPVAITVERRRALWAGALQLELPERHELTLPPAAVSAAPVISPHVEQRVGVESTELSLATLDETVQAARRLLQQRDPALRGLGFAGACLAGTLADSPAAQLGLGRGDCLLVVDGRAAFHWSLLDERFLAAPEQPHIAVALIGGAPRTVAFRLQARDETVPLKRGQQRWLFGAVQTPVLGPGETETITRGLGAALLAGVERTVSLTGLTAAGIGLLLTGQLPFASVGGPMMLFDLAGKTTERGFGYFFFIMAFISINLAVLNLLPVPVLDGGHLLFILIEAVRRRPLPKRAAEIANLVGLSVLLLLMLAVMSNDIARYWQSILGAFK